VVNPFIPSFAGPDLSLCVVASNGLVINFERLSASQQQVRTRAGICDHVITS